MLFKNIDCCDVVADGYGPCLEAVERPSGNEFDARRRVRTAGVQLIQSGEHERAVSARNH